MSARTPLAIDEETRGILARMTVNDTVATLPPGQLDRPVYDKVNKALAALGGKWNRAKRGHVFDADPTALLRSGVETGAVERLQQKYQFFETPEDRAAEMVARLRLVARERVLEPSAGRGRLCRAAMKAGATVTAVEIWDANIPHLHDLMGNERVTLADFLELTLVGRKYDAVLMNPPFANRQAIRHIRRAFDHWLRPGGRMVAICDSGALINASAVDRDFQEWLSSVRAEVSEIPAGTFAESGTNVAAAEIYIEKGRT